MGSAPIRQDWQASKVEDRLLAILRFAITLNDADLSLVRALADDMDRLGAGLTRPAFGFFERTSIEICRAVAARNDPHSLPALRRYIARIDEPRLKRAFVAAVMDIERASRLAALKGAGVSSTRFSGSARQRRT